MIIDLSANAKLKLSGSDRVRYLNGQVTNDVAKASAESAIAACVTTLKGKLEALVHITRTADGDAFLIDSDPSQRESLLARLDRYIIADDCELEDVTEAYTLYHVIDEKIPDGAVVSPANATRFRQDGTDVWLPSAPPIEADVAPAGLVEELRVRHGIPKWGAELSADTLPAEAGLDKSAIDFHKGCYIGQEVISRIESVGRVNRSLVGLESDEDLAVGMSLAHDESEVGSITSAAGRLALAFVKRGFTDIGRTLTAVDSEKGLSTECRIRDTKYV